MGFQFEMVLADCLYGESSKFIQGLNKFNLKYVVAIRSNHKAWLNREQEVIYGDWKTFERVFSNGQEKTRYIQEIIVTDSNNDVKYWKLTKDILMERKSTTWYLMSNLSGELHDCIGNKYGFRNWIEYGIKQGKNELGWADFRITNYQQIEKWWEIVSCAFLLVSLHAYNRKINSQKSTDEQQLNYTNQENYPPKSTGEQQLNHTNQENHPQKLTGEQQVNHNLNQENHPQKLTGEQQVNHNLNQENHPQKLTGEQQVNHNLNQEIHSQKLSSQEKLNTLNSAFRPQVSQESSEEPSKYSEHEWWDFSINWKSTLNNLRLIVQPYTFFNLISPWLKVFNIPEFKEGFLELINYMNLFRGYVNFDSR